MEVVRWLAKEPRQHLRKARFTIHSHNMAAAFEMTCRIQGLGYQVEARPSASSCPSPGRRNWWEARHWPASVIGRGT